MRVLLSTIGTRGEVQPLVALASRLRALGHEVRVCTTGPDAGRRARPGPGGPRRGPGPVPRPRGAHRRRPGRRTAPDRTPMAERVGFEPTTGLPLYGISSAAPSTGLGDLSVRA